MLVICVKKCYNKCTHHIVDMKMKIHFRFSQTRRNFMQTKVKFSKRVVSLATALVTGLSAVGVTGIPGGGIWNAICKRRGRSQLRQRLLY